MKILNIIDQSLFFIAKVAILLCMTLITLNSATRYLLNKPIAGVYEFTELFLMVMIVFLSVGYTWKLRGYIAITILSDRLTGALKNVVNLIILLAGIFFFGLMGYQAYTSTLESWLNSHVASGLIPWPLYLSTIWIPLGCLMITLRMVVEIIVGIKIAMHSGFKADMFPEFNNGNEEEILH